MVDGHRLRPVLVNLVGNAIKFTAEGSVCLAARVEQDSESPARLHIAVIDTGCGMQPETVEGLGSPFTQADASTTRRYGGTGLGLAISYKLIEAMGGTIDVQSSPGMGTSFTIALGLHPADQEAQADPSCQPAGQTEPDLPRQQIDLRGLRVLCVEDNKTNQKLIRTVLAQAGVEVRVVANGQLALQVATGEAFDAILMDMQMPVMDGYEATAQLRASGCELPIVALTAHALAGDREKCLHVGCNDYLTKPIHRDRLLNILYRLTRRRPACRS
jgi:CheY-like chemotaxis protein